MKITTIFFQKCVFSFSPFILIMFAFLSCGYDGPRMSVHELKSILDNPKREITVVDVRPSSLFKKGHVPRSINYPLENLPRTSKELAAIKGDLAIICSEGNRSVDALNQLNQERIFAILIEGGIKDWQAAGYPIDTGRAVEDTR